MAEWTKLIAGARSGDEAAIGRLYELAYAELRQIAHAKLWPHERPTLLNTTSLVHESYLRLVQLERLEVSDRSHFLAYAARAMRSIVVDFARRGLAERRQGGQQVTLDTAAAAEAGAPAEAGQVLRVHEALADLARIDARLVQVVEMRWFAGLSESEIAQALDVSTRTVEREWEKARLLLFDSLRE